MMKIGLILLVLTLLLLLLIRRGMQKLQDNTTADASVMLENKFEQVLEEAITRKYTVQRAQSLFDKEAEKAINHYFFHALGGDEMASPVQKKKLKEQKEKLGKKIATELHSPAVRERVEERFRRSKK